MDQNSFEKKCTDTKPVRGVVTASKCDCCRHHKIGVTTKAGKYIPLKAGMIVHIIGVNGD
jgi:hypothetical protein